MITAPWLEKFPYYQDVLSASFHMAEQVLPEQLHPACTLILDKTDHGSCTELMGLLERRPAVEPALNDFLSVILIHALNRADAFGECNLGAVADSDLRTVEFIPGVALDAVFEICKHVENVSAVSWVAPALESIIQWQKYGIELLKRSEVSGNIVDYSIDEAILYRTSTLVSYYRLLGNIMIGDPNLIYKYVWEQMDSQLVDDQEDLGEDICTQPNPYLALLAKYNLLDLAKAGKNMDYILFRHALPEHIRFPLIDEVDEVSTRYFEGSV